MPDMKSLNKKTSNTMSSFALSGLSQQKEIGLGYKIQDKNEIIESSEEALAVEIAEEDSLMDAIESMSLNLGSKIKDDISKINKDKAKQRRSIKSLKKLVNNDIVFSKNLTEEFKSISELNNYEDILSSLDKRSDGEQILLLTKLSEKGDSNGKKFEKLLEEKLNQPEWPINVMSACYLEGITKKEVNQLIFIYQKATDSTSQGVSLTSWFEKISHWENRDEKLKVLTRSLALEMSINAFGDEQIRRASALHDLQKISEFLLIEDYSKSLEKNFNLPKDKAMHEILFTLEQPWVYDSFLESRFEIMGLPKNCEKVYFSYLKDLFTLTPDNVFENDMHRNQIIEVIEKMIQTKPDYKMATV